MTHAAKKSSGVSLLISKKIYSSLLDLKSVQALVSSHRITAKSLYKSELSLAVKTKRGTETNEE